ncbi:MAG: bifunctional oligoribonuclease and phosphatase NrnA [Gaiellaceae bacterium]|jgi:phosphoesterase RecJ-like protein|nr:bifunctional oligoribonuclease and phosphatase NrnA [Gaiellaceae bacterium]
MTLPQTTASDLAAVAKAIREHDKFVITTHENPDGDALGSLLASKLALEQLGKDTAMVLHGDAPLPGEYAFMALDDLQRRWPDDVSERVLLAVDCANESRIADPEVLGRVPLSLDVDHHHDNTRFGRINLIVADASSTGEVLRDVFRELDVELTPDIAEALYIALVTDTGRFQYTNTTPKALRLAAELVDAGADVHRVFQGVYESVQFAKLKLLARALERAQVFEGGRIVVSYLVRTDFTEVGAAEPYSEGIIDFLRAVEGADMAVLIREPPRQDGPSRRVSLRASIDELDVSAIARKSGGGGHRQAAGFSSEASIEEITDFVRREFLASSRA